MKHIFAFVFVVSLVVQPVIARTNPSDTPITTFELNDFRTQCGVDSRDEIHQALTPWFSQLNTKLQNSSEFASISEQLVGEIPPGARVFCQLRLNQDGTIKSVQVVSQTKLEKEIKRLFKSVSPFEKRPSLITNDDYISIVFLHTPKESIRISSMIGLRMKESQMHKPFRSK